jgi:hypothetical protein
VPLVVLVPQGNQADSVKKTQASWLVFVMALR